MGFVYVNKRKSRADWEIRWAPKIIIESKCGGPFQAQIQATFDTKPQATARIPMHALLCTERDAALPSMHRIQTCCRTFNLQTFA